MKGFNVSKDKLVPEIFVGLDKTPETGPNHTRAILLPGDKLLGDLWLS